MAPRIIVVASLGAGLNELDFSRPDAPWLAGLGVAAAVAAIIVISVIARAAWRRMSPETPDRAVREYVAAEPAPRDISRD